MRLISFAGHFSRLATLRCAIRSAALLVTFLWLPTALADDEASVGWIEIVPSTNDERPVAPDNQLQVITRPAAPPLAGSPATETSPAKSAATEPPPTALLTAAAPQQKSPKSARSASVAAGNAEANASSAKPKPPGNKVTGKVERSDRQKSKRDSGSGTAAKARQVEVEITGIDGDLENNALSYLSLIREETRVRSRYQLRRLVSKGRDEIASALEVYGYYNSEVESDILNASDGAPENGKPWRVRFDVTPGERVVYDRFILQIAGPGAQTPPIKKAADELGIKRGDPLLHQKYEAEKRRILKAARDAAYLDAKYALSQLRVNPTINEVTAELNMITGAAFEFGEVSFEQDVLNDDLVRAFVPFESGDKFDSDKLVELQLALNDTRYFSRVEVDVDRDSAVAAPESGSYEDIDGSQQPRVKQLPVNVLLSEGKHRSYKAGVGYGTDTGGRVTVGYENRRINKAGHQLNAETRVSEIATEIGVRYSLPVVNKGTDRLAFDNRYINERPADQGKSIQQRSELRLERVKPRLRRSVYVAFEREQFTLGNDEGSSKLLIPGFGVTWLNTTNRLRPAFGVRLATDVHGAAEGFLTDTTFLQLTGETDVTWTFAPRWRVIGRSRLVYSILGDDFSQLPASQRQYAGGTGSVRGYGYQKLAPVDDSGDVIGGRHLSVFSSELEYQFANSWSVAAFFDTGNAGPTFLADLNSGAGLGLRWILPFGQVRFDVAMPLTGDEDQPRLHLSLGPDL